MEGLTPLHLIIVLVIAVLVLGPGKLPEVGAAIGKGIREFRNATSDIDVSPQIWASPVRAPATAASAPPAVATPEARGLPAAPDPAATAADAPTEARV
jgi:sec-independent protein translocase protein TatA